MTSKEGQETLARAICKAFTNYKKEVDRKSVVLADITPSEPAPPPPLPKEPDKGKDTTKTPPPPRDPPSKQETPASSQDAGKDAVIYKVQIFTSDKELQTNDKLFKGYSDIGYYREGRVYKYTYGSTTNYQEILTMQRKARADFPDAFIIRMKNGKRITP